MKLLPATFPLLVLVCLLSCTALQAAAVSTASLVAEGDALAARQQFRAALTQFKKADQSEPGHAEILVRISQQYSELVDATTTRPESCRYAEASLNYAKRAVQADPNNAKAHLALAIAYGKMTYFTGNKTKIEYSKFIRDETLKSIELDPTNDYAWHVLGRWHAGIAGLNPILKFFAKLVYGSLPEASNESAVMYLKKAAELAPGRILHHQELAKLYAALGKSDLARKEWQIVLNLPANDPNGKKAHAEAREALGE